MSTRLMYKECSDIGDEELGRWKQLYPKRKARYRTLNSLPALLLPYGKQVEHNDREAKLALRSKRN
jgi:hypothetical protein